MNPLLLRQLRKHAPQLDEHSEAGRSFLAAISATYDKLQQDERHLEHVLAVTSEELTAANERIRREADSVIATLNRRFELTLELHQGMIMCVRKTPRGFEHTLCRGELARRLGLPPERVEGRTVEEMASAANVVELTAAYERAWAGEQFTFTYTNARTGLVVFCTMRPRHEHGAVCEVISCSVDITALKETEAALRAREQLLSSINENLASTIIYRAEHPPSGEIRCSYVSPGTMTFAGVSPEEFLAHPARLFELIQADDRAAFNAELATALRTGEALDVIVRLRHATDGTVRWMHLRSRLAERRLDGTQVRDGTATDVTALKEAETQLQLLNLNLELAVQARSGELADSERLLAEVIESTSDGILVMDQAGRLLRANRRFGALWRMPDHILERRDLKSRLDFAATQVVDPPAFLARFNEILASERSFSDELHFKDGRVLERYTSVLRVGETIRGRLFSIRDVTARKKSEAALRESEARFRFLFEQAPDAIFVFDVEQARIVDYNQNLLRLFGCTEEDMRQHHLGQFAPEFQPDGRRTVDASAEYLQRALAGETVRYEWTYRTAQGQCVVTEVQLAHLPAAGRRLLRGSVIDITARKRAEAALRENEEKYRGVFDHSPVIICLLTVPEGRVVEANPAAAAAFGFTRDEAIGKTSSELKVWADDSERTRYLERLKSHGTFDAMEAQMRRRDGSIFTALYSGSLVSIGGRPYSLNLLQDITARKESERARDHLLALTKATLESTADGILVVDAAGQILTYNSLFAHMWRVPGDVLAVGDDERVLQHVTTQVADPERFLAKVHALYAQPLAESFDTIHFKDGRVFERFSRPQFVNDAPTGRVWSFRDVSARVRNEEALTQAHRHASVFAQLGRELSEATAPKIAALSILEAARQIVGWDCCWLRVLDPVSGQWSDVTMFDLIDGERREVASEAAPVMASIPIFRKVMEEGAQLVLRNDETNPEPALKVFGTGRRSLSLMFVPLRLEGRLTGILSLQSYRRHAYDQTALELAQTLAHHCAGAVARIQTRASLSETQERFRLVWESTADGMRLTDAAGRVVAVNAAYCRLMGKPREAIEGESMAVVYAEPDRERIVARHQERFANREVPPQLERALTLWDGRTLCLEVSNCFIGSNPGRLLLLGIFRDVTTRVRAEQERAKLEESLRQSQKFESLGTLAGGIAHDFNNILTGMFGFIELARQDLPPQHPAQEWLDQTLASSHRAKELVRQILTFSRRNTGERKPAPFAPLVGEALRLLRSTLPANIELTSRFAPGCPPVLADATQIHQVVMNLCTNAWHALPPRGGRIDVSLEPCAPPPDLARTHPTLNAGPLVRLTVADNGCGMEPATLQHIFEPFFTTKETGKGTGLGLAVVHGIVGSHGGAIEVHSAPGEGTTFELYFPTLVARTDATVAPPVSAVPRGRGEHILLIDDDRSSNLAIKLTLESLGYRVTACARPEQALDTFRAAPADFSLAVTDLSMPKLGGDEVAGQLLHMRRELPVLVITGFIEPLGQAALLRAGVCEVLHKPLTREELAAAVARHLRPD